MQEIKVFVSFNATLANGSQCFGNVILSLAELPKNVADINSIANAITLNWNETNSRKIIPGSLVVLFYREM